MPIWTDRPRLRHARRTPWRCFAAPSRLFPPQPGQTPIRILFLGICLALGQPASALARSQLEIPGTGREIWLSPRTDSLPGTGTPENPYNGSGPAFDARMRELYLASVTNILIHLLPGTYQTQGTLAWHPHGGWKIQGAGIDLTTIKLVNVSNNVYGVIALAAGAVLTNIEVADLTVDCNHSETNPNTAAAVGLSGSHHAIRRVKAINANGVFPVSETFILAIANGGRPSDGNTIEDCEVSSFKGTYCTAIALSCPIGNTSYISGMVRGNRVFNLHNDTGISNGTAYGGGGMKSATYEDNFCSGCDIAVNIDTGKATDLVFQHNRFMACRARGIGLFGKYLDNCIIENNLIEIDATAQDAAIVCSDAGGINRVTSFKIRNNTLRALNGWAGASGGIVVFVLNKSVLITGNRIEAGLRSTFFGSGIRCFDNTDFDGKPILTAEGFTGNQINLPVGEEGTLLLNKGQAHIIANAGPNPWVNGTNLISAYARAKRMRPHDQPLAQDNRATVFLLPGTYRLADSALTLDQPFVDLVGLGTRESIRLESEGNTLTQTADHVLVANLTLHCSSPATVSLGPQDKAAYFPGSDQPRTVIRNCVFSAARNGLGLRLGIIYAGHYESCVAGPRAWGGPGHFAGSALNCAAGDFSFGSGGSFVGTATNCVAGLGSFGGPSATGQGFHGVARTCVAGDDSFGGSGLMIGCEVSGGISAAVPTIGRLRDCQIGPAPGNQPALLLGPGASVYNCTVLANPAGNGFSIDALKPIQAKVAHSRLNHGMRNILNQIAQPANIEDPNLD